jgi:hyperosmotically inducible periplasmic protein
MNASLNKTLVLIGLTGALGAFLAGCGPSQQAPETTGNYIDDSAITAKVKAALIGDEAVKAFSIQVNTTHGVVELTGLVDNSDEKAAAAKDATAIAGVTDVKNDITTK